MKITRFDNYMDGEILSINVIITDITESDRRKNPRLYELIRQFKNDITELCK